MRKYYILIALVLLLGYSFYTNAKDNTLTFSFDTYNYSLAGNRSQNIPVMRPKQLPKKQEVFEYNSEYDSGYNVVGYSADGY